MSVVSKNYERIKKTLQDLQPSQKLHVIAITKYVDAKTLPLFLEAGLTDLGENRAQELLAKQEALGDLAEEVQWHFVGRLQRRPVKDIINRIDYLHSLDRLSLAKEVNKRAEHPIKCFLQVNVSEEDTKAGFALEEVEDIVHQLATYENIRLVGLMTMAPYDASEEELHTYFKALKEKQTYIEGLKLEHAPCHEVSMGMSADYPVAVQEGATYLRIGSAFLEE